ncbi:MAG: hypothetical protein ACI3ZC_07765 [Candidatus Cryptobacteroides sp.]
MDVTERLINIIEDRKAFDDAMFIIQEAAETKELPSLNCIPSFSDELIEDRITAILELVTGKEYK